MQKHKVMPCCCAAWKASLWLIPAACLPAMRGILHGKVVSSMEPQTGSVAAVDLPQGLDAAANAALIQEMLNGQRPVPASIATQVQAIVSLHRQLSAQGAQA